MSPQMAMIWLHRFPHLGCAGRAELGQAPGLRRDRAHVVEVHGMRRVLHEVDDVVHARDQPVDVVAIDRRDEGLVQQVDRGVGDAVGALFDGLDGVGTALEVVELGHQGDQFAAGLDDLVGVLDEQFEEVAFDGHQAGKHGGSHGLQRCGAVLDCRGL
jgi:hypothetical protein